jgi:glycosyltransferase involved in cell wall biosynthesis
MHLLEWLPVDPGRISVLSFPSLIDPDVFEADPHDTTKRFGLAQRFLVLPSQFWVHKNHAVVFRAMEILRDRGVDDLDLVCTGWPADTREPGHFDRLQASIEARRLGSRILILGLLPRHEQLQLMRRSVAVVQPSLFEGWSLLVEDARALGKRLYVSDIPVHREQQPPDAAFFPPDAPDALADLIAADVDRLRPGPDPEAERCARVEGHRRGLAYGAAIEAVARRAIEAA